MSRLFSSFQPFQFVPQPRDPAVTAGGIQPSVTARTYCPVPPTSNGSLPRALNSCNDAAAPFSWKTARLKCLIRVDNVDEVMGDTPALLGGWFGRTDIHAAVEKARIRRDDLAAEVAQRAGWQSPSCRRQLGRRGGSAEVLDGWMELVLMFCIRPLAMCASRQLSREFRWPIDSRDCILKMHDLGLAHRIRSTAITSICQ